MIYTILKTSLYISFATPEGRAYAEDLRKSFRGMVKEEESGMWFESFEMGEMKHDSIRTDSAPKQASG